MNKKVWAEIEKDYNTARDYLWCPKGVNRWHREEDKGEYYLLKAYLAAKEQDEKDDLVYARILVMMESERKRNEYAYVKLKDFIQPALDHYNKAIEKGQHPTKEELESVKNIHKHLSWDYAMMQKDDEYYYSHIKGIDKIPEFQFPDSRPIRFSHNLEEGTMVFEFDDTFVELKFKGLIEVYENVDLINTWISEFYCGPLSENLPDILELSMQGYRIECKEIIATRVDG